MCCAASAAFSDLVFTCAWISQAVQLQPTLCSCFCHIASQKSCRWMHHCTHTLHRNLCSPSCQCFFCVFALPGNRHYHNLAHLMCMFDFVKRASKAGIALVDAAAVEWAVWFHDIVYTPCSKSNEADSAELAGKWQTIIAAAACRHCSRIV